MAGDYRSKPLFQRWATVVFTLQLCGLFFSEATVVLEPYDTANCSRVEVPHGDLQEVLIGLNLAQPSSACVVVNVAAGNYTISQTLNVSQNLALQGIGGEVRVSFNVTKPSTYQVNQPFYVLQFLNSSFAAFSNIHFIGSPGIIGFENVTEVRITNCTFSYFVQGAVDMYRCSYPTVVNCTFQNNGPAAVIKPQSHRGHSAGLSIVFYFRFYLGYNPRAIVSGCRFINNSAIGTITASQSATLSLQNVFILRGGGMALVVNTFESADMTVSNCTFANNAVSVNGGAVYILESGTANHSVLISGSTFFANSADVSGGGVYCRYGTAGNLTTLNSVLVYDSIFTANSAPIGGAASLFINVAPPKNGEIGDYSSFRNCLFQTNSAVDFGAAIAVASPLAFSNREKFIPMDITNCTFVGNEISNSGGGIVGGAYVMAVLNGTNIFSRNSGASILLLGSVMRVAGSLQITNNTNSGQGGAVYILSFGRIILYDNVKVIFDSNNGSSGAAIVSEGSIPEIYHELPSNRLCFIQHPMVASIPNQLAQRNVSLLFANNNAPVGAAMYVENVLTCAFYYNAAQNFATYINNVNNAHQGNETNTQWDIQTPPAEASVQNRSLLISAYAGAQVQIYMSVFDELNKPVSAVFRVLDITYSNESEGTINSFQFQRSLIVYNNLKQGAFDTAFSVPNGTSGRRTIQISTLQQTNKFSSTFEVDQIPCPLGNVLSLQMNGLYNCQCNSRNPSIADCGTTTIVFPTNHGGLWGGTQSSLNEYGDNLVVYPCPMGYCRCCLADQGAGSICLFTANSTDLNNQCVGERKGTLCGGCNDGFGVSALLNNCVTCGATSGLLIAGLIVGNVIATLLLIIFGLEFPSWLYPCIFYLQFLPYATERFPVPFNIVHHYLYYVSSGLSFYFVYDFCLYSEMSPLVSYFIRYIPLLTAIIACPIILAIRHKIRPRAPWHGLWWIVVLMYTHVVHTSMSILNCPRLPGKDGNMNNVWYINGNIECFTGGHTPLAILAILILILCTAIIPLIAFSPDSEWVPKWLRSCLRNITPPVEGSYREGMACFRSLDLLRRIIVVLLIIAVPGDEYSAIFFTMVVLSVYGYVQPYKHTLSNVLEVVLPVDVLILFIMKNTNQIRDSLIGVPPQLVGGAITQGVCTDNSNILGPSPLVALLTPFYYFPLVVTAVGGVLWTVYHTCTGLHSCLKQRQAKHRGAQTLLLVSYNDVTSSVENTEGINKLNRVHELGSGLRGPQTSLLTPYVQLHSENN